MLTFKDNVKETCSAPGTATFTLAGAVGDSQLFSTAGLNGATVTYWARDVDANGNPTVGGLWEEGEGVYTASGTTLTRVTIRDGSSGAGNKANFAGTTHIELVLNANSTNLMMTVPPMGGHYILNGDFKYAQRATTAAVENFIAVSPVGFNFNGANGADTYVWDQWKCNLRTSASGISCSSISGGPSSSCYGSFTNVVASKILAGQPIEAQYSQALSNQQATVTFKAHIQLGTGTLNVNIGILKWTGTADALTKFTTAWSSSAGSDPTWNTSYTMLGKTTLAATTSWQQVSTTVTLPTGVNNLIPMIWTDADPSGQALNIAEAMLFVGSTPAPWTPRPGGQELAMLQRYCRLIRTIGSNQIIAVGNCQSATSVVYLIQYSLMRGNPTCTTSAASTFLEQNAGLNHAGTAISTASIGPEMLQLTLTIAAGGVAGQAAQLFDNSANATILLDAGL